MGLSYGTTLKLGKVRAGTVGWGGVKKGKGSKVVRDEIKLCEGLMDAKADSNEGKGSKIGSDKIRFWGV